MERSEEITDETEAARWLLLIHQLPAKPAYPRVKIWRRLQAVGAVTVKNSVYVLPADDQRQEDFEWVLKEVVEAGGEGLICEGRFIDGLSDGDVRTLFNTVRDADYDAVAKAARDMAASPGDLTNAAARAEARSKLARLKAETARVAEIDFFGAEGRQAVEGLLGSLQAQLREEGVVGRGPATDAGNTTMPRGRVWVTRQGAHVDRIASAWLIRRFIDPEARFKFVAAKGYVPEPGEVRFDMFEAEFTHEGDRCTFETLLARAELSDPGLVMIGEIVHDIDLKDQKFGREETGGIARLIEGLATANKTDEQRITRGAALFEDLYQSFRGGPRAATLHSRA